MKKNVAEEYRILINARNFHFENFNRWMTFYYVAVGVLFVGYYTIQPSAENNHTRLLNNFHLIILFLGYFTSLFWHMSCKGFYFWVLHWITFIQDFEKENNILPIYGAFNPKIMKSSNNISYAKFWDSSSISTSKITLIFSYLITVLWGSLLFEVLVYLNKNLFFQVVSSVVVTVLILLFFGSIYNPNNDRRFRNMAEKYPFK